MFGIEIGNFGGGVEFVDGFVAGGGSVSLHLLLSLGQLAHVGCLQLRQLFLE